MPIVSILEQGNVKRGRWEMVKDLGFYLRKFAKLNTNRKHGVNAPHKPILLLSVIELIEQQKIRNNQISLTPELIATFLKYWDNLVTTPHRSNIALPFFHLTGDKFWHLALNSNYEGSIKSVKVSLPSLRHAVRYACVDTELFELLLNPASRVQLVNALIQTWFPRQDAQVQQLYQVDEFQTIQHRLFEKGGGVYDVEDLENEEKTFVRSAAFRKIVISLYDQRCAFCGLRIISSDSQNIVDGAHIKPFSEFRDDRFDNGLALCKNHHWAFDRGWFSISDAYQILIPRDRFTEESPQDTRPMHNFNGEPIFLPNQEAHHPRLEALAWHRQKWNIAC
jgi:putative restriction endonuclease